MLITSSMETKKKMNVWMGWVSLWQSVFSQSFLTRL